MRQTLCKGITFLYVFALSIAWSSAQDSIKSTANTTSKAAVKSTVKPAVKKTISPLPAAAKQTPANTASQAPAVQNPAKPAATSPASQAELAPNATLDQQYQYLLKRSWPTKTGWKVINPASLTKLWTSVNDSLAGYKKQLAEEKLKTQDQAKIIAETKTNQAHSERSEPKTTAGIPVSEVDMLGMPLALDTYNMIVWGAILALAIGLAAVIFTTSKNSNDAKHHKQLLDELNAEYNTFKAKAKEKELKLARELQTERNTIEELQAKEAERRGKNEGS